MLLGGHIEINVFKYKQVLYLYLNVMLFTCSMKQKKNILMSASDWCQITKFYNH